MTPTFYFTYDNLEAQYQCAIENGYTFLTCEEYVHKKNSLPSRCVFNRVDVDLSIKKADRLLKLFNKLEIHGTFFVRLHAPEYNPFSFENYRILKNIRDCGHEIGYHSEIIDQAVIWGEEAADCLLRDIEILNQMLDISVQGVASHGGLTGLNNLDFWKEKKAADFGLLYEAYDTQPAFNLFNESYYISDSEWTRWKCYDKGGLVQYDARSLSYRVKSNFEVFEKCQSKDFSHTIISNARLILKIFYELFKNVSRHILWHLKSYLPTKSPALLYGVGS